jgi:hypothetical protein
MIGWGTAVYDVSRVLETYQYNRNLTNPYYNKGLPQTRDSVVALSIFV